MGIWQLRSHGANLNTGEVPSLGEVASSAARSFVQTVGEQGARIAQDSEGQHAADGSEKCIAEHMDHPNAIAGLRFAAPVSFASRLAAPRQRRPPSAG
jgi:hypothetical protein